VERILNFPFVAPHHTPPFFQRVIGPLPSPLLQCEDIAEAIRSNSLVACSDVAYDANLAVGSQGWVLGDKTEVPF
jgi:hypothetical protein